MSVRLKNTDTGMARFLKRFFKSVDVGILGGQHPDGLSNVELGTIHEFGAPPRIPQRSFIRETVDRNQSAIQAQLKKELDRYVQDGSSIDQALARVGLLVEGMIKERISDRIPPPNAQSTIDRKGSSTPLVDTGQLRNSITSRVNS